MCTFIRICVSNFLFTLGTAAKNDIFKGLNFKPMGFLVLTGVHCLYIWILIHYFLNET